MGIISKIVGSSSEPVARPLTRKTYLKIKIISLADEARTIRREESRWINRKSGVRNHPIRMGLKEHRTKVVRPEARHALLAYGFLRGRTYKQIEAKCHKAPSWERVRDLVVKYGNMFSEKERKIVLGELLKWSESN